MVERPRIGLVVHGAGGRMGTRVCAAAKGDARFELLAGIDRLDTPEGEIAASQITAAVDAVIDFSVDAGARLAARFAAKHSAALLVATTGLSAQSLGIIEDAARSVPVMIAPNTSLGVAVANHLTACCARLLSGGFDVDIIETHHAAKQDAPSGTALRLAESVRLGSGAELPPDRIHSLRSGDVVGAHTVQFAGPGEIIRISHLATNRDLFALGALRAAAWLIRRSPGRYTIEQAWGIGPA